MYINGMYIRNSQNLKFIGNSVNIIDISCGQEHNLALSNDGRVFAQGDNNSRQCGVVCKEGFLDEPLMIEDLKGFEVDMIKCGFVHSY